MALSQDLLSQFAKITNDNKKNKDSTAYGTIVKEGNTTYVKLDGSNLLTPYDSTIAVEDGDRVTVTIKNHTAVVDGNITSPAASDKKVNYIGNQVTEFHNVMAYKIKATDIEAANAKFDSLIAIAARYEDLEAVRAEIETLKTTYANIEYLAATDVEIINAQIESLKVKFQESESITTQDLEASHAQINQLEAFNANFSYVSTEKLDAAKADIAELNTTKLSAEDADIRYANIGFTNIQIAAIETLFSESGIIKDITTQSGKITGKLVGVTIKGDLIEGNTITADKLVILGEDGTYYKLNIDGLNNISTEKASKFVLLESEPDNWETNYTDYYYISNNKYIHLTGNSAPTWQANTYYKLSAIHGVGLDGTNIIAQTITADKITVSDLVAFGATIGGFHISDHSLYSGVKNSIDNTTRGIYLDDNGQIYIGDGNTYIKHYQDQNNVWKMEITGSSIHLGSGTTVEEIIYDLQIDQNGVRSIIGDVSNKQNTLEGNYEKLLGEFSTYKENKDSFEWNLYKTLYGDTSTQDDPRNFNDKRLTFKSMRLDDTGLSIIDSESPFSSTLNTESVQFKYYNDVVGEYNKDGASITNLKVTETSILGHLRINKVIESYGAQNPRKRTRIYWIGGQ